MDSAASNGAQVYADGKLIDREVYSHLAIRELARVIEMFDNLHLALFDRTKSFLLDDESQFVREVDKDLPNAERVWDLPDPEVNILKASIFCDDGNVMDNAYVLQRELGDKFVFAPSGNAWIDALQLGVTKASGIAQIMGHYGIKTEEVMAFGDSMNDCENRAHGGLWLRHGKWPSRPQGRGRPRGGLQLRACRSGRDAPHFERAEVSFRAWARETPIRIPPCSNILERPWLSFAEPRPLLRNCAWRDA